MTDHHHTNYLKVKNIGIDTYRENIVFMRYDCEVCRSEGLAALTRVVLTNGSKSIIATLNVITSELIAHGEVGLSIEALKRLNVKDGDTIHVSHLSPIESFRKVRSKMYGKTLDDDSLLEIMSDIVAGRYSNIELAAFITACVGSDLSLPEIIGLTKAMISTGNKLAWGNELILDKHCVGGLPGNRTTPIVVSIVAACGLMIPKTSSRAITSPAGTADTMETMTPVTLSLEHMRQVVERENACIVWGGGAALSPADDILISIEKALDIDSEGQMIASVVSKKMAAGSTHVVIDIPVGETAKVRSSEAAQLLQQHFETVGAAIGLNLKVVQTDGTQPIGKGIGPALEAHDVLNVLRNGPTASQNLKDRALLLAGILLELSGMCSKEQGLLLATQTLESGNAYEKFIKICEAQGGFHLPGRAGFQYDVVAQTTGIVMGIDNRTLAKIAKLAGAPRAATSGIEFHSPLGRKVTKGDPLYTIHAESHGELEYACEYVKSTNPIVTLI